MDFHDRLTNIDAEMSVLGASILDPERFSEVRLRSDDFFDKRHKLIFGAALDLTSRNEPLDVVALTSRLQQTGKLTEAGGTGYLSELADFVPASAALGYYAKLVREAATRRRLADKGREIARIALDAETASEALDQAEASLLGLRSGAGEHSGPVETSCLLGKAFRALEKAHQTRGSLTGVPTGFADLDRMTCGLQPADLIIIAGRPSMGKTALGLNIAENAASSGCRVLVFSLEMSKEQLTNRLIASNARVDAHRFRTGQFRPHDWQKMTDAAARIQKMPLLIDDSASPTVLDIRAAARRVLRNGGLSLIVIDYLQLMRPAQRCSVREREVAEISRSLKALAKELNIPVIVLAQLNRNLETGTSPRRPIPSDLRESGSLEQDADVIIFPWRESAYCQECRRLGHDCGKGHYRTAELIIGKQRNGPTGSLKAAWLPELCRFESLSESSTEDRQGQ